MECLPKKFYDIGKAIGKMAEEDYHIVDEPHGVLQAMYFRDLGVVCSSLCGITQFL